MGFIKNIFNSKSNKKYQSSYPDKVEGLTNQQVISFDLIANQYKKISLRDRNSSKSLELAFFDRYDKACIQKDDMDLFFKIELEVLDLYKRKNKEKVSNEEILNGDTKKATEENKVKNSFKKYPKIFVHENASERMEKLYGALVNFDKKYNNGILQSTRIINETEFHEIVFSVIYGLEDFTKSKGKFLPFYFSQYSFELDQETRNQNNMEKEIFTRVSLLFDKIKKIVLWIKRIDTDEIKNNPFYVFRVNNIRIEFTEFFQMLEREAREIIDSFELNAFS